MLSIQDFVSKFGEKLNEVRQPDDCVLLPVVLLNVNDDVCAFAHLGTRFSVNTKDIVGVDPSSPPIPNPFAGGVPCSIQLAKDAQLTRTMVFSAADLVKNLPYSIARPSQIQPYRDSSRQEFEQAWLDQRGLSSPIRPLSTYTATQSSQFTGTRSDSYSNGMSDDTYVDDNNSDSMGNDDNSPDDEDAASSQRAAFQSSYSGTSSSQYTGTRSDSYSNGMSDDTYVDDSHADDMGNDDNQPDD